jgi:dCMP deaminase
MTESLQDAFESRDEWHKYYLGETDYIATKSKDPSRRVGAIIVRPDHTPVSQGFNGFARGVKDLPERYENREMKLDLVVHSEVNAIITARESLAGYTIYTNLFPCCRCAGVIINSGIKRVVTYYIEPHEVRNYEHHMNLSRLQFDEAGITVLEIKKENL